MAFACKFISLHFFWNSVVIYYSLSSLRSDLLHVTTEVQIGERLLLLGIVICSLFGFLFLLASSFILKTSFENSKGLAKLASVCVHQCEVRGNVSTHLQTLLSFPVVLAADPMLLCSLGAPFLLRNHSHYNSDSSFSDKSLNKSSWGRLFCKMTDLIDLKYVC